MHPPYWFREREREREREGGRERNELFYYGIGSSKDAKLNLRINIKVYLLIKSAKTFETKRFRLLPLSEFQDNVNCINS